MVWGCFLCHILINFVTKLGAKVEKNRNEESQTSPYPEVINFFVAPPGIEPEFKV